MKRTYRMLEAQFRNYFKEAAKSPMVTGEKLIQLLEGRLDNAVYRMGVASSRNQGRQFVLHGLVTVNERKVNLPPFQVKPGDTISLTEKGKQMHIIQSNFEAVKQRGVPAWFEVDAEKMTGRLLRLPTKEEVALPVEESMVIELYSR
jgi:small subunit ribosomal protein S4